jgi:hypothetical protein
MVDTQIPGPLAKSKTRSASSPPEDESHGYGLFTAFPGVKESSELATASVVPAAQNYLIRGCIRERLS